MKSCRKRERREDTSQMEETPKIQPAALAGVLAPCRMTLTGDCEEGEGEEGRRRWTPRLWVVMCVNNR